MADNVLAQLNADDGSIINISFKPKNGKSISVDQSVANSEAIPKVEISSSFCRPWLQCIIRAKESLFTALGLKKSEIKKLVSSDTFVSLKILRNEVADNSTSKKQQTISFNGVIIKNFIDNNKDDPTIVLIAIDMMGYKLKSASFNIVTKLTELNSKTITPIEAFKEILEYVNTKIEEDYKNTTKTVVLETDKSYTEKISDRYDSLVNDTLDSTEHNKLPIVEYNVHYINNLFDYLQAYARKHNIKWYQDWKETHLIQTPRLDKLKHYNDDKEVDIKEVGNKLSKKYIWHTVRLYSNDTKLISQKLKITNNAGGTTQDNVESDTDALETMLTIDNTIKNNEGWSEKPYESVSNNLTDNDCTLYYDMVKQYSRRQKMIVYLNGFLDLQVGQIINVKLLSEHISKKDQTKGDIEFSGDWVVDSMTVLKISTKAIVIRLGLHRYEIPYDNSLEDTSTSAVASTNTDSLVSNLTKSGSSNSFDISNIGAAIKKSISLDNFSSAFGNLTNLMDSTNGAITMFNLFMNQIYNLIQNNPITNLLKYARSSVQSISNYVSAVKNQVKSIINMAKEYKNTLSRIKITFTNQLNELKDTISLTSANNYKWQQLLKDPFKSITDQVSALNTDISNLNQVLTNFNYTTTTSKDVEDQSNQTILASASNAFLTVDEINSSNVTESGSTETLNTAIKNASSYTNDSEKYEEYIKQVKANFSASQQRQIANDRDSLIASGAMTIIKRSN